MSAAFNVMVKPTGAVCNLGCRYCYFLSKEQMYPGSHFRMTGEVQERYIKQLLEAHRERQEVVVAWQGGEPTIMGLDFFRRSIELEEKYRRPGQRIRNTIQTNGTLLNAEWAEFLAANDFLVGISIDGPPDIHDGYRVDKGGKPTFKRVLRGLDHLKAHGVEWNVLTCVHAGNGDQGRRVYHFLRDDLQARFIQFIPVVERAGPDRVSSRSVAPGQYGRFLVDVFEDWVRHDIGTVYVQMFDTALGKWCGLDGGLCVHGETCGLEVALEHTGDVYSCDHFVAPRYRLGNIGEHSLRELVTSAEQRRFGSRKRDTLTRHCHECDVRFACNGGCPKDRFATSPTGESNQNYLCPSYEIFFRHVDRPMREMAALLSRGQAPAALKHRYAATDRKRGRNDPCPCNGGRKWRRCHGRSIVRPSDGRRGVTSRNSDGAS